ncbi:hypothetical protein [Aurantiacibacter marinus]|uniref:hypothetical protein n=1 Tax=Aurantiacibacter marinus TaxID=874156 RepID=UPI0018CC8785|nr:hypothetical protein [Aurantiacibacter marinus]
MGHASVAVLASFLLVSCGGDDSSPTPTGSATPTPTPPPAPPPPTFTYTQFANLTGVQDFATACIEYGQALDGVPRLVQAFPYSGGGNIDLDAGTAIWTVTEFGGGVSASFGPGDIVSQAADRVRYDLNTTPLPTRLSIFQSTVAGTPAAYGRRTGYLLPTGNGLQTAFCTLGVPTDPDDIPAATTVTYTDLAMDGFLIQRNPAGGNSITSQIVSGTGTISGNTTNGSIRFSISYVVEDSAGARRTVGPISGDVDIDLSGTDRAGYFGLLNFGGMPEYQITGGFYGPQGRETGFVVAAQLDQDSDGRPEEFLLINGYATR